MIEAGNAGAATNPHVALDPKGNAVAVWAQYDDFRRGPAISSIWVNSYFTGK